MSSLRIFSILSAFILPLAGCGGSADAGSSEQELGASADELGSAARSLSSEPDLIFMLDRLGEVAAGGASLEAFLYKNNPRVPAGANCAKKTAEEAGRELDGIVDMVMSDGDP